MKIYPEYPCVWDGHRGGAAGDTHKHCVVLSNGYHVMNGEAKRTAGEIDTNADHYQEWIHYCDAVLAAAVTDNDGNLTTDDNEIVDLFEKMMVRRMLNPG